MEIEISSLAPTQAKVVLRGRLDTAGADRIEMKLVGALVPRGLNAIVDLSEVDFVASLGLRLLISVARSLSRKNAQLVLFAPQEGVREVFASVSLGDLIAIRDTEADALAVLQAQGLAARRVMVMPTREHALRLSGDMPGFERGAAAVRSALDACAVTGRARYWVEVVFEEIVTNVVRHGYTDQRAHDIDVRLTCGPDAIVLAIEDDGQPFDPLKRPAPLRPASIEEVTLGGLGIPLVRKAATDLRYERTADGKNRLTVTLPAA